MDPIVAAAVSALSAGALAVGKEYATEAIKDSYKALKGFVIARFAKAAPAIELVEQEPASEPERQMLAARIGGAAGDAEIKALVDRLLAALETLKDRPEAKGVIDLARSHIGAITVEDTTAAGPLLVATDSTAGDVRFKGFRQTADDDKKKP